MIDAPIWVTAAIQGNTGQSDRATLARLWERGTEFLGCPVAILGGAMSLGERAASGVGHFQCRRVWRDRLRRDDGRRCWPREIAATQTMTSQPFGVNPITMHPQLDDLIRVSWRPTSATSCWPAVSRRQGGKGGQGGGAKLICFAPALVTGSPVGPIGAPMPS